jgi:hypothetical protein
MKLSYSIDKLFDIFSEEKAHSQSYFEAINQFSSELHKDSKSSTAVSASSQKISKHVAEIKQMLDRCDQSGEEVEKLGRDFQSDLQLLLKVLAGTFFNKANIKL